MCDNYTQEALNLVSINERFDNESFDVKVMREFYIKIADTLIKNRDEV